MGDRQLPARILRARLGRRRMARVAARYSLTDPYPYILPHEPVCRLHHGELRIVIGIQRNRKRAAQAAQAALDP